MTSQSQKKIADTLRQYKQLSQTAAIDLAEVKNQFRAAQGVAKAEAQQALPAARRAYFDAINEISFKIFVSGKPADVAAFVTLSDEADLVCLDAMEFYRNIGVRAASSIGPARTFGSTQLALITNDIREWIFDNKHELPMTKEPTIDTLEIVTDDEAVFSVVRKLIRASAGDVLNSLFLRQKLIGIGLENGYNKPQVPVLIHGFGSSDEQEVLKQVVDGPSYVVTAKPETASREGHRKVLSAIQAELKQYHNQK